MATAADSLPLLPTTVVGSHPRPAWWWCANEAIQQGRFGERGHAGDARPCGGHRDPRSGAAGHRRDHRRRDAAAERLRAHACSQRIQGLSAVPATARRWGPPHYDMDTDMQVEGRVSAPDGLGVARDFAYLNAHTTAAPRPPVPARSPSPASATSRRPISDVWELAHDVAKDRQRRAEGMRGGGRGLRADRRPVAGHHPRRGARHGGAGERGLRRRAGEDGRCTSASAPTAGRPRGFNRTYRPLFPDLLEAQVDQFVLEFTNRQMADIDLWQEYQPRQELVVGVVDQKCFTIETPEFVADRIRTALKYVPADKLWISARLRLPGGAVLDRARQAASAGRGHGDRAPRAGRGIGARVARQGPGGCAGRVSAELTGARGS